MFKKSASIKQKIRKRNLALNLVTAVAASSITMYAVAASEDYDRIKKDISVMIGIVKSSFANDEDCRRCNVRVSGHYLADQGIVFNVNPASGFQYSFNDREFEHDMGAFVEGIESIPSFVNEILNEVRVEIGDNNLNTIEIVTDGDEWNHESRETKQELREIRSEIRERAREIRDIEIESIHADAKNLKNLEKKEANLESEIANLETKEREIREKLATYIEQKTSEAEARKAKRDAKRQERFEAMETVVLNTFCDYSSTMRNLPKGERISVIVKKDEDSSNVYVFEQSKLDGCDSADGNVREHALSYAF